MNKAMVKMSQIHAHLQEASSSATPDAKSYLQKQSIVLYIERKIRHLTQGQTCQLSIQTQSRNGYGFQTHSSLSTFLKYESRTVANILLLLVLTSRPPQHLPHNHPPLLHLHPDIADTQTQGHSCCFLPL